MPTASPVVAPAPERKAVSLEKRGNGRWEIVEFTIAGEKVIAQRVVDKAYFRDLAEDAAVKWIRRAGR